VAFVGGAVAGCGPESGCDHVLHSRWSQWLGLPVSLFALACYGALLVATCWLGRPPRVAAFVRKPHFSGTLTSAAPRAAQQRKAWIVLVVGAMLILGSVLWFVGLQLVVIKHLCRFCMLVHTCGVLTAVLILKLAPVRPPPAQPKQLDSAVFLPPPLVKKLALAAVAGVAALVLGQVLYTPRMFLVRPVEAGKLKPAEPKSTARIYQIYNGQFQFNLDEVPLIGNPQAPQAMLSLFDYTCSHCRQMHPHLLEAQKTFSNELVVVSLPMPLDSQCNPSVKVTPRPHVNACEYARLGLAVWRANRRLHHAFEAWMFAPENPPPLDAARQYAARLLGDTNALDTALADPWIGRQIQQTTSLYATNYLNSKNGQMPQMLIGTNLVFGNLNRLEDFYRVLARQLGLRAAPTPPLTTNQPGAVVSDQKPPSD
jgi:uncharacterized membrane protein